MKTITYLWIVLCTLTLSACWSSQEITIQDNNRPVQEKTQILALWDSLTAGYNLPLEQSYPSQLEELLWDQYEIINAWVSGDTSAQLLDRVDLYIQDENNLPSIAIVTIGWNDGLRGQSLEQLENNLNNIITKLIQKDVIVVVWGMRIPINLGFNYSRDFKALYEKVADQNDVYLIEHFLKDVEGIADLNLSDRIHPNKQGYAIVAENIYNFLEGKDLVN